MAVKAAQVIDYIGEHPVISGEELEKQFGWAKGGAKASLRELKKGGYITWEHREGLYHFTVLRVPHDPQRDLEVMREDQREACWEIYYGLMELADSDVSADILRAKTETYRVALKAVKST